VWGGVACGDAGGWGKIGGGMGGYAGNGVGGTWGKWRLGVKVGIERGSGSLWKVGLWLGAKEDCGRGEA